MSELSYQDERPRDAEILALIVETFDATPIQAMNWLARFDPFVAYAEYMESIGAATEAKK